MGQCATQSVDVRIPGGRHLEFLVDARLVPPSVTEDAVDRLKRVSEANFFAVLPITSVIGNGNFRENKLPTSELGRDLRLNAETVLVNREFAQQLRRKDFVASLHVGQVEVGKHVG